MTTREYHVYDLNAGDTIVVQAHDATAAVRRAWLRRYPQYQGIVSHFRSNGRDITGIADDTDKHELFTYGV